MTEPVALHEALSDYFSISELRTLCFDLNIEYEDLGGDGKSAKALSLVQYAQRHHRYDDLVAYVRRERPHVSLSEPPAKPDAGTQSKESPTGNTIIHIHGGVGPGSVVGGGSVQAEQIAGRDIHIGQPPQDTAEFTNQLAALKALLEQAIADGEFENSRDGETAVEDLQDVIEEIESDEPRPGRMNRRLEDISESLASATQVAQAAGRAGTAIFKAAPIAAALLKAVTMLF